jgi:hypothetical protein
MNFIKKFYSKLLAVGFRDLAKGFVRTLIVWWFVLGVICAVLFSIQPGWLGQEPFPRLLELLATVFIAGGVFETIVKSFQFSGLFRDELKDFFAEAEFKEAQKLLISDVIHDQANLQAQESMIARLLNGKEFRESQKKIVSEVVTDPVFQQNLETKVSEIVSKTIYKPAFLEHRKDIEDVWRQVTEVLYKSRFKDISQRIANKVLQEYFPVGDNFYYDEFRENVEITFCDPEKVFIQSKETISLTIRPIDETQKVKWGYRTDVLKRSDDTRSTVELIKLEINQADRRAECNPPEASKDGKCLSLEFAFDLEGAKEYKVVMEMKRVYNPAVDAVRDFVAGRFVNSPELRVKFPEELSLTFQPVGTRKDAYKDMSAFRNVIWNVYEDLIFPNQGYRIMFSRSENSEGGTPI